MSAETNIEWADRTASPWYGCQHVSPACDHCYAEAWAKRSGMVGWGPQEARRRSASYRKQMEKWNREAEAKGVRFKAFASLCDPLDNAVPAEWFADYLDTIRSTPHLDHLMLTKRVGNWRARLQSALDLRPGSGAGALALNWLEGRPPANVWLGATVVNQDEADRDVPKLLNAPARVRFLSIEPMLRAIDLTRLDPTIFAASANALTGKWKWEGGPTRIETSRLDWVIAGGESGPHARPMHPDWIRSLRDQCAAAGVPFLFKQWGEWSEDDGSYADHPASLPLLAWGGSAWTDSGSAEGPWMVRIGKKAAGRTLDGRTHTEFPA